MDTILTILKFIAIIIGIIIAIPVAVFLFGIGIAIIVAVLKFLAFILLVVFALIAGVLNSFFDLFFTQKNSRT